MHKVCGQHGDSYPVNGDCPRCASPAVDTFKDKFYSDLEAEMSAAFDCAPDESGHIEADDLLVRLVEKLLTWHVPVGGSSASPMEQKHYLAVRRTLALYKDMPKRHA